MIWNGFFCLLIKEFQKFRNTLYAKHTVHNEGINFFVCKSESVYTGVYIIPSVSCKKQKKNKIKKESVTDEDRNGNERKELLHLFRAPFDHSRTPGRVFDIYSTIWTPRRSARRSDDANYRNFQVIHLKINKKMSRFSKTRQVNDHAKLNSKSNDSWQCITQ